MKSPKMPKNQNRKFEKASNLSQALAPQASEINNRDWINCIIIFALALILRLAYYFSVQAHPFFQTALIDSAIYDRWANQIFAGDWLSKTIGPVYQSPGYAYFLAITRKVIGTKLGVVFLIQFLVGSLNCALIYLISKLAFKKNSIAIMAASLCIFYGFSIFIEGTLTTATWINFFNLLSLTAIYFARLNGFPSINICAGLSLGISSMFRPNVLIVAPFIAIFLFISNSKKWTHSLYFILGLLIYFTPVVLRNAVVENKLSISTVPAGGMVLYVGNVPQSKYIDPERPEVQGEIFRKEASLAIGRQLTTQEASDYWFAQTISFITQNPRAWLSVMKSKGFSFLSWFESGSNYHYYFYKHLFPFLRLPFFTYALLMPFGIIGLFFAFRISNAWPISIFLACYVLSCLAFLVTAEYRYSAVPQLMILAAFGVYRMIEVMRERKYAAIGSSALGLIILYCLAYLGFGYQPIFAREYQKLGVAWARIGNADEAIKAFKLSADISDEGSAHYNLAEIYLKQNKFDLAVNEYSLALRTFKHQSERAMTHLKLGSIYIKLNNLNEAENHFKDAISLDPKNPYAHESLGNTYYLRRSWKLCQKEWQIALDCGSNNQKLIENLEAIKNQK